MRKVKAVTSRRRKQVGGGDPQITVLQVNASVCSYPPPPYPSYSNNTYTRRKRRALFLLHTLGETPCNVWSISFSRGGCFCYSPVQAAVPWGVPLPSSGAAADVRQSGQVFPIPRRPYEEEKTEPATLHKRLRQHLEPLVAISDQAEGAENPALLLGG